MPATKFMMNCSECGRTNYYTAKNRQNKDLVVEINLAGFTSVYDSETALTFDQFRQETTGANALEQVLQDRAEQIRREKAGESTSTDTTAQ